MKIESFLHALFCALSGILASGCATSNQQTTGSTIERLTNKSFPRTKSVEVIIAGSPAFSPHDFEKPGLLVNRIVAHTNALSTYIWNRLSPDARQAVLVFFATATNGNSLTTNLVLEFNQILTDPSLYDASRFEGIQLRAKTKKRLQQPSDPGALVRLNRLLLEDGYSVELPRNRFALNEPLKKDCIEIAEFCFFAPISQIYHRPTNYAQRMFVSDTQVEIIVSTAYANSACSFGADAIVVKEWDAWHGWYDPLGVIQLPVDAALHSTINVFSSKGVYGIMTKSGKILNVPNANSFGGDSLATVLSPGLGNSTAFIAASGIQGALEGLAGPPGRTIAAIRGTFVRFTPE